MWIDNENTNIQLQRNAVLGFSGTILDKFTGEPALLVGSSIVCAVALAAGGAVITNPVSVIDDPLNGGFSVELVGSAFAAVGSTTETVNLAYDIRITQAPSGPEVVMRGTLFLLPGVGA